MRMGYLAGMLGGMALLSGGCFEGPDWPPSVQGSDVPTATGGSGPIDGGTHDAGLVGPDSGLTNFACIGTADCENFLSAAPDSGATLSNEYNTCLGNGGTIATACPGSTTLGAVVGCCTVTAANGTTEECYYGSAYNATTLQANCSTATGSFSTNP